MTKDSDSLGASLLLLAQRPNYAIKPTPEQALRSSRAILPARLIAALELMTESVGSTSKVRGRCWSFLGS